MSEPAVAAETCVALGATGHQFESYPGREVALGALTVTRVLPVKGKRLIGPWCSGPRLDAPSLVRFATANPVS